MKESKVWLIVDSSGNILPFEASTINKEYATLKEIISENFKECIMYTNRKQFNNDIKRFIFERGCKNE